MPRQDAQLGKSSRLIVVAAVCVFIAALYFGRDLLIPMALAILATFVLFPVVQQLEKWRFNRATATVMVVLLSLGVFAGIGYVVSSQAESVWKEEIPRARSNIHDKLGHVWAFFRPLEKATGELEQVVTAPPPTSQPTTKQSPAITGVPLAPHENIPGNLLSSPGSQLASKPGAPDDHSNQPGSDSGDENAVPVRVVTPQSPIAAMWEYLQTALGPLATASVVVVLIIFMLLGREDLRDRLIRLFGHGQLNLTTQAIDEVAHRITRYLVAQSVVNICYGLAVSGGLWLIGRLLGHASGGFPNVLLWGLLCAMLRFIPYVGIWIAMLLPVTVSFALFQGNSVFGATVAMFVTYELVVSQFVEPYVYGSSTGMSPLAVLLAAVFWTVLWGPIGLLLSTPMTVCLVVLGKYVPQLEFLNVLLGDEPVLEPPVRIYQRLIALDQEDAGDLLQQYLKEKSLEEVYDQILLPVLAMAERDRQHEELDEQREEYVHTGLRELIEELGEQAAAEAEAAPAGETAKQTTAPPAIRFKLPTDCRVSVYCLPARDEADELAAMMLVQLLNLRGYCAESISHEVLSGEMLELIEKNNTDVVVVSALPPTATSDARYLTKRLRARFPELPLIVGLWTFKTDLERARRRISRDESVKLVTTLAQAQEQIDQRAQHVTAVVGAGEHA
jgi:predicted PurR-regulated permease PerM